MKAILKGFKTPIVNVKKVKDFLGNSLFEVTYPDEPSTTMSPKQFNKMFSLIK